MRKRLLHVVLRDEEDYKLCKDAAKANKFPNLSEWIRACINGHLNMMGWPKLKYVSRRRIYCKNGHKYTKENTYWRVKNHYRFKVCRECLRISARKTYRKKVS